MNNPVVKRLLAIMICGIALISPIGILYGDEISGDTAGDDTLLMFVGEDVDVLSIASRREESAWRSPAVAQVITREEIERWGVDTLSEALERAAGFHMAEKEWGSRAYLRGIADSVLFLFDTIPMGSNMTKSMHSIDEELSLDKVKRIEIIRGPGSVLWGPDAFAGIVNVVPLSGKDLNGVETGAFTGGPDALTGAYLNAGYHSGYWDTFWSVSGKEGREDDTSCNVVSLWGDEPGSLVPVEQRFGDKTLGTSHYSELFGRVSYRDWLTLSGRFSDSRKPYAVTDSSGDLTWPEMRETTSGMIKLEALKKLDIHSAVRFTGAYNDMSQDHTVINDVFTQNESMAYAELIYDRSFFSGRSLLTSGVSYRRQAFNDVPVWGYFFPEYIGALQNLDAKVSIEDYDDSLWSFFSQYSHKISDETELMAGLRYDAHDACEDKLSFNSGVVWAPQKDWIFKLLYGTAYRSPSAKQQYHTGKPRSEVDEIGLSTIVVDETSPGLERITSWSAQAAWKPSGQSALTLTWFDNYIEEHRVENDYGGDGFLLPNRQHIRGLELEVRWAPMETLNCFANATFLDNSGPNEHYLSKHYREPQPDETYAWTYQENEYHYDSGPDILFNLGAEWSPVERFSLFTGLRYFSERDYSVYYSADDTVPEDRMETKTCSDAWLLDINAVMRDVLFKGTDVELSVRNAMDRDYDTPGTYHSIEGQPATIQILIKKRW